MRIDQRPLLRVYVRCVPRFVSIQAGKDELTHTHSSARTQLLFGFSGDVVSVSKWTQT